IFENGGGISLTGEGSSLDLQNSEIRNNGDGIDLLFANAHIANSTIAENAGTGIHVHRSGLEVINSTISGNVSDGRAGGVDIGFLSGVTLTNVTIAGNRADKDNSLGADQSGGGIYLDPQVGLILRNSIVANNLTGSGANEQYSDLT